MEYLFDCWQDFLRDLQKAKAVALFFDYDGTLTPIVKRPELATLSKNNRLLIKKIARKSWAKVSVVSGRTLKNVKKLVGVKGIIYAGNHGLELEGPKLKYTNKKAEIIQKKCINVVYRQLKDELGSYSKILIEHKGLTLSVHYRLEKDVGKVKKVFKIINGATRSYIKKKKLRVTHGKKVVEIKPKINWHKGKIVQWLLRYFKQNSSSKNILPIYLGDDTTDEDAFKVLRKKGIGIFVGNPKVKSLAKYYLRDTTEVSGVLERIVQQGK